MKFKTGDYLTNTEKKNHCIYRVVIALDNDGEPIYACLASPKNSQIDWYTEKELLARMFNVVEPDFKEFKAIKMGDLIRIGETDKYVRVLARIEDCVLLSNAPSKELGSLVGELDSLLGGHILGEEDRQHLKDHGSMTKMHQEANDWWHIDTLALMNWTIIKEEA